MNFENLTIVSVIGHSAYTQGSMFALQRSCEALPGAKGLLISPDRPANLPNFIEHQACNPFGYLEYSVFIIYLLEQFIHTDYCLIVQNDGWVLNGNNWREEFWQYDYIGSGHPILFEHNDNTLTTHRVKVWEENLKQPNPNFREFQNGGFSLRSKRLLQAPRQLNLPITILPPLPMDDERKLDWRFEHTIHNEDMFFTGLYRQVLEEHGFKFATPEVSSLFSVDNCWVNYTRQIPIQNCLGGHFSSRARLVAPNHIECHMSGENKFIEDYLPDKYKLMRLLADYGYQITYKD